MRTIACTDLPPLPQRRDRALCPVSSNRVGSDEAVYRLNEGTGRYARSDRRNRARGPRCRCLNEGTGRYARSALRDEDQVRRPRASTKGPGVMPGQFGPHTRGDSKSKASTKGPGVMPGQRASMTAVTCSVMPQRRDRALCPVSRRLDAARLLVLASTKGPGVMPGQLDASAEGRPAVGRASTKGPGVMPGQAH